jgi:RimJ/RimL family protein N-acetyltransferase
LIVKRRPFDIFIDIKLRKLYPELQQLDPPVGQAGIHVDYSIFADDNTYLGLAQIYNYNARIQFAELGIGIYNKNYWRKGYGRRTMQELLTVCSQYKLKHIKTKVVKGNDIGVKFNESCGFKIVGEEVIDGMTFVVFNREL